MMNATIELAELAIGNGSISFRPKSEAQLEAKEQTGEMIVVNATRGSCPAHFQVAFTLNSNFAGPGGLSISNVLHWKCIVPG